MIKILYLILFYFIYRITDLILLVVLLIQTGLNIFSGEPSDSIKAFGRSLGAYLQQISEFLSYASEEKPFPFSDWPDAAAVSSESSNIKADIEKPLDSAPQAPDSKASAQAGEQETNSSDTKNEPNK